MLEHLEELDSATEGAEDYSPVSERVDLPTDRAGPFYRLKKSPTRAEGLDFRADFWP